MAEAKTVTFEDAELIFKNFAGREDRFNREGDRNFAIVVPPDVAQQMEQDGWNIKWLEPRDPDEGEEARAIISVAVSYKSRPPRVTMINSVGRTILSESMLELLDYADIELVDVLIRGYDWDVNGKQGTKAYLQTMFVTVHEDELERKYAIMPSGEGDPFE